MTKKNKGQSELQSRLFLIHVPTYAWPPSFNVFRVLSWVEFLYQVTGGVWCICSQPSSSQELPNPWSAFTPTLAARFLFLSFLIFLAESHCTGCVSLASLSHASNQFWASVAGGRLPGEAAFRRNGWHTQQESITKSRSMGSIWRWPQSLCSSIICGFSYLSDF